MFGTDGGVVQEFDTLTLRMEANDGWQWSGANGQPQYARDEFGRRTQLAMGQPSGHGRNVHLYLNGLYWGVYNLVERPDASFAEAYLNVPKEEWDGINTGGGINGGSTRPWRDLLKLTNAIRTSGEEPARTANYFKVMGLKPDGSNDPELESFLDVDNFIDYLLVNWYMGNTDWPHNNYYCGRAQGPLSEGYKFFMWDAEWTLFIGGSVSSTQMLNFAGVAEPQRGLRNSLEYRTRFGDRAHRALFNGGPLTPEECAARYDDFVVDHPLILIAESARWGDQHRGSPRTTDDWSSEYRRISNNWFPQRTDRFITQLRSANLLPNIDAPVFSHRGGTVAAGFSLSMTSPDGGAIYYTLDGTDPRFPVLGDATSEEVELVAESAARSFRVPIGADDGFAVDGIEWSHPNFVESDEWMSTTGPVGFESSGGGYSELVELDIAPLVQRKSAVVMVRIPFTLTEQQLGELDYLNLEAKYDDGFVAYINGVKVASANAPEDVDGLSRASATHRDNLAVVFEEFGASAGVSALRAGENVLGVLGLNASVGGSDFFNSVRLTGGANLSISRGAKAFGEPIALSGSATVKARVFRGEEWSALEEATFLVGAQPASRDNVVVSEFGYEPPPPTLAEVEAGFDSRSDFEFLEITNISAASVDLSGGAFSAGVTYVFEETAFVGAGESALVVGNRAAFLHRYGEALAPKVIGQYSGKLSNGGEAVTLADGRGEMIQSFTYSSRAPWPSGDSSTGFSLDLIAPEMNPDPSIATNWSVSSLPLGSPGRIGDDENRFVGDPLADIDEDGVPALLEYAFGRSDVVADSTADLARVSREGQQALFYEILVNPAASDVVFSIERSSNLMEWNDAEAEVIEETPVDGRNLLRRIYRVPIVAQKSVFLRLSVALARQ